MRSISCEAGIREPGGQVVLRLPEESPGRRSELPCMGGDGEAQMCAPSNLRNPVKFRPLSYADGLAGAIMKSLRNESHEQKTPRANG